jgi:hypothetical protein
MAIRNSARALAWALWTGAFSVLSCLVLSGHVKDVPYQAYLTAGRHWLAREPLYDLTNIDGFQYLPPSAAWFGLLARLPAPLAAVLWRGASWVGFATGLQRGARLLMPERSELSFLAVTCLTLVPASNVVANGQANLALAALSLHAAAALSQRRYAQASTILSLGFALKPLLLVPLALVLALYPQTRRWSALWLTGPAGVPFALSEPSYALEQYLSCARKLQQCAQPDHQFEDLRSLLWTLQLELPDGVFFALRAACAIAVLALGAKLLRRCREPFATSQVLALALGYLMLFNPRTLSTSYVMVTGFGALFAVAHERAGRPRTAAAYALCVLAWHLNRHVFGWAQHWLNPLAGAVYCGLLVREAWLPRQAQLGQPTRVKVT